MAKQARKPLRLENDRPLALAGLYVMILGGLLTYWRGEPLDFSGPKMFFIAGGLAWAWLWARRAAVTAVDWPVAVFAGAALASTMVSVDVPQSVLGDYAQGIFGLIELALYASAFYLGASSDERAAKQGRQAIVAGSAVMATVCGLQLVGLGPPIDQRTSGTAGSPVAAGVCLAAALPLALYEASCASLLGRFAVPVIGVGLVLTKTRSAWLAAAAGCAFWLAGSGRLKGRRARLAAAVVVALAIGGSLAISALHAQGDAIRVGVWRGALAALRARPWLGFGPDTFSVAFRRHKSLEFLASARWAGAMGTEAHNDLLQIAVTQGLIGLAAYIALQIAFVRAAWLKRGEEPGLWSAAMGAILAGALVAKLNPLPNQALAIGAWLAGTMVGGEPAQSESEAYWRILFFRGAGLVLAAGFAAIWLADLALGRAGQAGRAGNLAEARAQIDTAVRLTPIRLEYAQSSCELSIAEAKKAATPQQVQAATAAMLVLAKQAASLHAGNPQAHEIFGTALLFASSVFGSGLLPGAKAELELASSMDPTNPYPIQRRLLLAKVIKDEAAYQKAAAELARIQAQAPVMEPDAPGP